MYGASQFAGGGFMPSPGGTAAGGYSGGGGEGKKSNAPQTLRAVTMKQILRENTTVDDDQFKVDGIDITVVTVVGRLLSAQESGNKTVYMVDDGTSRMEVSQWNNDNDEMKPDLKTGAYVRVYGNVRSFDRKISINAYSVKPMADHNEITYHFLQCIFQHLHLTKQQAVAGQAGGRLDVSPPGRGATGNPADGMPYQQQQQQQQQQQGFNMGNDTTPNRSAAPATGKQALYDTLTSLYKQPDIHSRDTGMSTEEAVQALRQQGTPYTPKEIIEAIDFLLNEGLLYSITDDYYKSTVDA